MRCHPHSQIPLGVVKYARSLSGGSGFGYRLWQSALMRCALSAMQHIAYEIVLFKAEHDAPFVAGDPKKCCLRRSGPLGRCPNSSTEWIPHLLEPSTCPLARDRSLPGRLRCLHEAWWLSPKTSSLPRECLCDMPAPIARSRLSS